MSAARALLDQWTDADALDAFIARWRGATLPKADWTHAAHVAVCAWHAWPDGDVERLVPVMRAGIRAYNEAVGTANTPTSGYHETLTRFWCLQIVHQLATAPSATRLEAVRRAVETYGEARSLHADAYSFDVVRDIAARASWVPPDRVTNQDK